MRVMRSDSSRDSEMGECLYHPAGGGQKSFQGKLTPGEEKVQLQLCWELVSGQELQRQTEGLRP